MKKIGVILLIIFFVIIIFVGFIVYRNSDYYKEIQYREQFEYGIEQIRAGQFKIAYDVFAKLVEDNKNNPYVYAELGTVKRKLGDLEGSLKDYNTALQLEQGEAWMYAELGCTYKKMGNKELALQNLKKAIYMNPNLVNYKKDIEEIEKK